MILNRPVASIASSLGKLSQLWLKKNYSYRKKAIERLQRQSHFCPDAAQALLDSLFKELTGPKLARLLKSEFRDPKVLDEFRKDPVTGILHRAQGPGLITHIFAGNVPNPSIVSFIFGMLLKSSNAVKASSRDKGFLDIYLKSLREFDPDLAASQHYIHPRDRQRLYHFIRRSDWVVAYGTRESLSHVKSAVPEGKTLMEYGPRTSFVFLSKEILNRKNIKSLSKNVARDFWMLYGRGCLSPETLYAEKGGEVPPSIFSEYLIQALEAMDFPQENLYVLKNHLKISRLKNNFFDILKSKAGELQCVALEAPPRRRNELAEQFSKLGVNRICRAGRMQEPPITWHHDGKFNLASWVTWTDLEG